MPPRDLFAEVHAVQSGVQGPRDLFAETGLARDHSLDAFESLGGFGALHGIEDRPVVDPNAGHADQGNQRIAQHGYDLATQRTIRDVERGTANYDQQHAGDAVQQLDDQTKYMKLGRGGAVQQFNDEDAAYAAAHPDHDAVGERIRKSLIQNWSSFKETAAGMEQQGVEGAADFVGRVIPGLAPLAQAAKPLVDRATAPIAKASSDVYAAAQKDIEANGYKFGSKTDYYGQQILDSLVQMAPTLATAYLSKGDSLEAEAAAEGATQSANPIIRGLAKFRDSLRENLPSLSVLGEQQGAQEYGSERAAGRTVAQSNVGALVVGLAEALPEGMELNVLMKPGGKILPRLLKSAGLDGAGEMLTQIVEEGYQAGVLKQNMTWDQAWKGVLDAGVVGTVMGTALGGGAHAVDQARGGEAGAAARSIQDAEFTTTPGEEAARALDPNRDILPVPRQPTAPGTVETARQQTPPVTAEDEASPLPTGLIAQGKALAAEATGRAQADQILQQNQAPPTGTRVRIGQKEATVVDAFTEGGEAGVTLQFGSGQHQKLFLNDLADAGVSLEPVQPAAAAPASPQQPSSRDAAIRFVMNTQEGGSARTVDSGGVTRFGISQNAHPEVNVDAITEKQAVDIYRKQYWDKLGLDGADPAFAAAALDTAINHGMGKGRELIAEAGGDVGKLIELRQAEYDRLARENPAKYAQYAQGWHNRLQKLAAAVGTQGSTTAAPATDSAPAETDGSDFNFLRDSVLPESQDSAPAAVPPPAAVPTESLADLQRKQDAAIAPAPTPVSPTPAADQPDLRGGDLTTGGQAPAMPVMRTEARQLVLTDLSPETRAAIDAALPGKARLLPRSDGAFVAPVKHEDAVRAVLGDGSPEAPISVQTSADVARASERVAEPTEAQKESGNYRKAHVEVQGLPITIENPKGSTRSGVDPDGKPWSVTMPAAYGYVKRTVGQDQENVDIYVGDHPTANTVYVVDQVHADTKAPDEHKVMLGFSSPQEALDTYHQAFSDGRGPDRVGAVTPMSVDEFKGWLKDGDTTKPVGGENVGQEPAGASLGAIDAPRPSDAPAAPVAAESAPQPVPAPFTAGTASADSAATQPEVAPESLPPTPRAAPNTPAFHNWFGESRVTDETGAPRVVYHGTSKSEGGDAFSSFDTYASNYGLMGQGGYFTESPEIASQYTKKGKGDSPTVYPTYLSIKNPIGMEEPANPDTWKKAFPGIEDYHEGGDTNESWYRAAEESIVDQQVPKWEGAEIMQDGLRAMGHDGITHMGGGRVNADGPKHRVWIAFDPEQIKSATGNRGTFDPNDPRIHYSRTDEPAQEPVARLHGRELGVDFRGPEDMTALRKAGETWYASNLLGKTVTTSDGKQVSFTGRGMRKTTSGKGDELLRAIPAIRDILEKGTLVSSEPGRDRGTKAMHAYAASVEIGGKPHRLVALVRETPDGKFHYDLRRNAEGAAGAGTNPEGRAHESRVTPALDGAPDGDLNIVDSAEGGNEPKHRLPDAEQFATEAGRADMAAKVRAELQKRGVADKVALNTVDLIFGDPRIAGRYFRGVMDVALEAAQSPTFTANHEVVHFLKEKGLFRSAEWTALSNAALADGELMASIERRYPGLSRDGQIEEAVSDMSARFVEGNLPAKGFVRTALQRMVDFLKALGSALRGQGFATAEGTLRAFERGDIGRRGGVATEAGEPKFATVPADSERASAEAESDGSTTPPLTDMIENEGGGGGKRTGSDTFDTWRTALQDRMLPLLRTQQRIETVLGRELDEGENPYLAEELMTGKVGARLDKLSDDFVNPLFAAMKEEGVSVGELESYLYARHAAERNAQIAKINPEFSEGEGSGMTDIEAAAILARIEKAGRTEAIERVADKVDAILRFAVDTRVESGLVSRDEADAWRQTYEHYVPLRGQAESEDTANPERPRSGSGINVRGKESQRAFGRRSKASDILAHSIMQAQEAIVRAETNEVGQRLLALAKDFPDANFWTIDKVRQTRFVHPTTGQVTKRSESRIAAEDAPYTVSLKVDGEEHRVTFNRDNPDAMKLADAMRNLTGQQFNAAVAFLGKFTRFFSAINTRYAPPFIVTNAIRDAMTASVTLQQYNVPGLVTGTIRDYRHALVAPRNGDGEWSKWRREFELAGGKIYFNDIGDINTLRKKIERDVNAAASSPGKIKMKVTAFFDGVQMLNDHVENAIRLAAYKNAREGGLSKDKAASIARNVTVNFTRRGKYGPVINSAYAFFNASTQGSATLILAAMKSRRVRASLGGFMVAGFLLDMLNNMIGDDDDDGASYWSKIPEFEKERNLILMVPGGKGREIKLPLGLGLNAFFNTGRVISEIASGRRSVLSGAGEALWGYADGFNPLNGGGSVLNYILPTIADPIGELVVNRNFAGKPIQPDQSPYDPPVTPSANFTPNVSPVAKALTDAMNKATGGDEVQPGKISVSPNVVQYLFGYFTGSAGRFYSDVMTLPFQKDATINDVPFVNKVVGAKPVWYDKSVAYARLDDIEQRLGYAKGYQKAGDAEGLQSFVGENGAELRQLVPLAKWTRKEMGEIRKARGVLDVAHDRDRIDDATFKADKDRLDAVEQAVIFAFNKRYLEVAVKPVGLK